MQRMEVQFEGRIQGVGFRAKVLGLSRGYAVTGLVRNQEDGSVFLCAEGLKPDLQAFLESIEQHMTDHIRQSHVQWSSGTGKWPDFRIDYNA